MTRRKAKIRKNLEGDGKCDRISSLPANLIDLIMEFLPMRDAARTCVLSSRWRYVWTNHPSLVIDKEFWNDIKQHKLSSQRSIDFVGIVNRILLHHIGNIEKFVFEISVISCTQHRDMDPWLSSLSRRGVKVLSLDNDNNLIGETDSYRLPSCVFSNPQLTNLSISNCVIKMTKEALATFSRLQSLSLSYLALGSCVLITPLLTSLSLMQCSGIEGFSISAAKLVSLTLIENDTLNLIPYLMSTNIISACIHTRPLIEDKGDVERVNFLQLLPCWPKMLQLELNASALRYLAEGTDGKSFELNLRRIKLVLVSLELMDMVHCILRNSPSLQIFEIGLNGPMWSMTRKKYLEPAGIWMEQLHTVKLTSFRGSRNEVEFVKFLLQCSPSLNRLLIKVLVYQDEKKLEVVTELLSFPRASPKAKVIVL